MPARLETSVFPFLVPIQYKKKSWREPQGVKEENWEKQNINIHVALLFGLPFRHKHFRDSKRRGETETQGVVKGSEADDSRRRGEHLQELLCVTPHCQMCSQKGNRFRLVMWIGWAQNQKFKYRFGQFHFLNVNLIPLRISFQSRRVEELVRARMASAKCPKTTALAGLVQNIFSLKLLSSETTW